MTETGIYRDETPWGTLESYECPDCSWNDTIDRVRNRGECENCGRPLRDTDDSER